MITKILFLLFALVVCPALTFAESSPIGNLAMISVGDNENGYFVVEGKPGERKTVTVNIKNVNDQYPAAAALFITDAITAQGGGMGTVAPEQIAHKQTGGWFENAKQTIELKPNGSRDVPFSFTIPSGTAAGDHIANIVLYTLVPAASPSTTPGKNGVQIMVNKAYSQAIAVLVKVPGAVQHNLVLATLEPQWNGSSLFLKLGIANQGNVIEKSKGKVQILSGEQVIFEQEGSMDSIYPQTTGIYSFPVPVDLGKSGDYSAKVTWEYADRVAENSLQKLFSYKLSSKDVKNAIISELATQKNDKKIPKNVLILEPKDIVIFAGIVVTVLLLAGATIFWFIRTRRNSNKQG